MNTRLITAVFIAAALYFSGGFTHIAGAGDRVLFDRLHDRWTSLRHGTRSGPEVPARGRVVGARHTTLRIPL